MNDPIANALARSGSVGLSDLEESYFKDLSRASDQIKEYLLSRPTQRAPLRMLITMAEKRDIKLRFTMMSALSHEPDRVNRKLRQDATAPFRPPAWLGTSYPAHRVRFPTGCRRPTPY